MTRDTLLRKYLKERNIPLDSLEACSIVEGIEWADTHPVNPWHKASEELPKENLTVLGVGISGYHYVCRYMYGHWFSENNLTERIIITHWMPIPKIKED